MNAQIATTAAPTRRWQIQISDRADLVFSLRDYFRRLGVTAEVGSPTLVELSTDRLADEIEEYVAGWARVNGAPLHAEQVSEEAQAPMQLLVPPPATAQPPRLGELLIS